VLEAPIATSAGPNEPVCGSTAILAATAPVGAETGQWTITEGSGNFADATLANTSVSGLSPGENTLKWTVSNAGCNLFDEVTINSSQINISMELPPTLCQEQFFDLSITPSGGQLTYNGTTAAITQNPLQILGEGLLPGLLDFTYMVTDGNGCTSTLTNSLQVVDQCPCSCADAFQTIEDLPSNIANEQDLLDYFAITGSEVNNKCIRVNSNLQINSSVTFRFCSLIFMPGVEVKNNGFLEIGRSHLMGCDRLWRGISNSGKMIIALSKIRDAQYAVTMNRGTTGRYTRLRQVIFSRNFVGLTNSGLGDHLYSVTSNIFDGGPLLPDFSGQDLPSNPAGGLTGILLVNGFYLAINTNIFKNLYNGIIVDAAKLDSKLNKFENIQHSITNPLYSGNNYWLSTTNSAAINILPYSSADIRGFGTTDANQIDLGETDESRNEMKLYNMLGQNVLSLTFVGNKTQIDLQAAGIASGLYFVEITNRTTNLHVKEKLVYEK